MGGQCMYLLWLMCSFVYDCNLLDEITLFLSKRFALPKPKRKVLASIGTNNNSGGLTALQASRNKVKKGFFSTQSQRRFNANRKKRRSSICLDTRKTPPKKMDTKSTPPKTTSSSTNKITVFGDANINSDTKECECSLCARVPVVDYINIMHLC